MTVHFEIEIREKFRIAKSISVHTIQKSMHSKCYDREFISFLSVLRYSICHECLQHCQK